MRDFAWPAAPGPLDLDEAHPQLEEHLLEQLAFLGSQVAACLLFHQREDVDHPLRRRQVGLVRRR